MTVFENEDTMDDRMDETADEDFHSVNEDDGIQVDVQDQKQL